MRLYTKIGSIKYQFKKSDSVTKQITDLKKEHQMTTST